MGLDEVNQFCDPVPQAGHGSLGRLSQQCLQFRECLLDGVEIRTVWRQEHQPRTGGLDQRLCRRAFVAGKVVEDDDVTWFQCRDKHLADIGLEPRAIDRPIDDQRRNHSGVAQARDQRRRLAVTVRDCHPQPLTFGASSVGARHIGRRPCFIDEDEAGRIKIELLVKPTLALLQNVRTALLYRVACLFLRV